MRRGRSQWRVYLEVCCRNNCHLLTGISDLLRKMRRLFSFPSRVWEPVACDILKWRRCSRDRSLEKRIMLGGACGASHRGVCRARRSRRSEGRGEREAPPGMINGPFRDHFHNVIARESVASAPSRWREIGQGWAYPKSK